MNKSVINFLMAYSAIGGGEYGMEYLYDQEVNECLMDLYFYMLYSGINEEKQEEYFQEFGKKFKKLNKEQQEMVKNDYIEIIEAQYKNREKVKRKGNDKYE